MRATSGDKRESPASGDLRETLLRESEGSKNRSANRISSIFFDNHLARGGRAEPLSWRCVGCAEWIFTFGGYHHSALNTTFEMRIIQGEGYGGRRLPHGLNCHGIVDSLPQPEDPFRNGDHFGAFLIKI